MSASKNSYAVLGDQDEASAKDYEYLGIDENGEEWYRWETDPFNVVEFERSSGHDRIFTRKMLEKIKNAKESLIRKAREGDDWEEVYVPEPGEMAHGKKFVVGQTFEKEIYHDQKISLSYLPRVQMHPDFHRLRTCSPSVKRLREMNPKETGWLPVPFELEWKESDLGSDHHDVEQMNLRRHELQEIKTLWEESAVRSQFREAFRAAPALKSKATRIKRVACFALGTLDFGGVRELQHLAMFDLATMLGEINRSEDPKASQVEVALQDPSYKTIDHILLKELYQSVRFVEDPDGILRIDKETLVVGVYPPTSFPIMQVVADMFEEGDGPAAFLIDNVKLREPDDRNMYRSNDRLSPRASRMMQLYWKYGEDFQVGGLKDVFKQRFRYSERLWLEDVEVYVRREPGS